MKFRFNENRHLLVEKNNSGFEIQICPFTKTSCQQCCSNMGEVQEIDARSINQGRNFQLKLTCGSGTTIIYHNVPDTMKLDDLFLVIDNNICT